MNDLGWCYFLGEGVAKDEIEGIKWWKKGAAKGDANAQKALKDRNLTW